MQLWMDLENNSYTIPFISNILSDQYTKHHIIKPYYMEGTTPDQRSFGSRSSKQGWYQMYQMYNHP